MHARKIVERLVGGCLIGMHAKRSASILAAVTAVLRGGNLSLSQLARSLESTVAMRHRIKRMDRLLGSRDVHLHRIPIYRALAAHWLEGVHTLLIVVDWSDMTEDQHWHLLRASVAVEGRSVTLYEEVHPRRLLGNRQVHDRFLKQLSQLLPAGAIPILVTDAGFRSTWFELVNKRRWGWIGRIRNRDMISLPGSSWQRATDLYAKAGEQPQAFEGVRYVRNHPTACRLVLVKKPAKGREHRTRLGARSCARTSLKAAQREREPWLLACAPGLSHLSPAAVAALYAQRMRIEQSFRDTKNVPLGLGMSASRSRSPSRLEILLLIGHLAAWVLRIIGESAQQRQLQLRFQSTCRTDRKEISVMTLARRLLEESGGWLRRLRLDASLPGLQKQVGEACRAT